MSRKACLLTQNDVPKYIKEIVKRLRPVQIEYVDRNGNWWGYTYRLDAKWKCGYESQLEKDCEKLIAWCESWYAYAKVIRYMWWSKEVATTHVYDDRGTKYHKRKALREGWRNHVYLVISDPVANRFEKDLYYK